MEIAQEDDNGKPCLPLFFELEDANQVSCVCNDIVTLDKSNASSNDKNNRQYLKQ